MKIVARMAARRAISKAALEHRIPIKAVVVCLERPTMPVPKGVIPHPPDYTACIAHGRAIPDKVGEQAATRTTAQMKTRCEAESKELRVITLNTLITWYWTLAAGKEYGVKASEADVRRWLEGFSERTFPKKGEYATYLKLTGQTASDMLLRGRVQLFESKIFHRLGELQALLPKGLPRSSVRARSTSSRRTCRRGSGGPR